ncbi:hypothetical protein MML48_9g00010570 [Holotrichia oblita]|uniref:Uncharacterized protein n=1 Tax=Holotrichia oblita TaxID=644536 RepID=A0ACB9SIM2_HOLOL|nr:hypothetical protein MML48_9g00010570 [Holotrichia oblita]
MTQEIIKEGEQLGLIINETKTKLMRVGNKDKENKSIALENYVFEEVDKFKYLSRDGSRDAEIKEKIMAANRAFYANKKLLKSRNLAKTTKVNIYNTLIRPVLMYLAETMTMTKKDEENIRIFERKY